MQPLLSIVLPIYNVEKYLDKCLKSILSQKFDDYEIVAVNDGSLDNSLNILNQYKNNKKLKIYSQENKGLSATRNFAIDKASGKYIIFLDSDDYLSENCLESLSMDLKRDYDVYISRYNKVNNYEISICDNSLFININNSNNVLEKYITNTSNFSLAQRTIVKRLTIMDNALKFEEGRLHEDLFWSAKLFDTVSSDKVFATQIIFYNHVTDNIESITNNIGFRNFVDVLELSRLYYDKLKSEIIKQQITNSIYSKLFVYYKLSKVEKKWIRQFISRNRDLFKSRMIRHKLFYYANAIFGAQFALLIIKKFIA